MLNKNGVSMKRYIAMLSLGCLIGFILSFSACSGAAVSDSDKEKVQAQIPTQEQMEEGGSLTPGLVDPR